MREPLRKKGNRETLSMVMVDYDYDGDVFDLGAGAVMKERRSA